jgi:hypothetical protein
MALYTDYLVPFEVASLFLLVAMIGAIVIGKRELSAIEEASPRTCSNGGPETRSGGDACLKRLSTEAY